MENASKALIIAGAILLAILIISLGILIFQQASGVVENNSMDQLEIENFNTQFQAYEGEQKGTAVRALLNKVLANNIENQGNADKLITVNGDAGISMANNATSAPTSSVNAGATYNVTMTSGTSGLINTITINR